MGGNSIKTLSKRCLHRLSSRYSLPPFQSPAKFSCTDQPRRIFSSPRNLTGIKSPKVFNPLHQFPASRSIATLPATKLGFLGWYLRKLESNPVVTKSVTTSVIFGAADVTAQMITPSSDSFDSIRALRMAAYGFLFLGPSQHVWFNFISTTFPKQDAITTLKKILMAQVILGPTGTSAFFTYNSLLQGENCEQIVTRLKRDLLPTLITSAMYWPFCDFATFRFIPVPLQPLMNSSSAYFWTIYLTYRANSKIDNHELTAIANAKLNLPSSDNDLSLVA